MTPEEARQRARSILEQQSHGQQVIHLNADGTLRNVSSGSYSKKTVLHDPKGEY
jgi:hypothetical protein